MKLALVHDLAECIVGDIAPSDNVSKAEKHRREKVQIEIERSVTLLRMKKKKIISHTFRSAPKYHC